MDAERSAIAETCMHASHNGSLSFPDIIGKLLSAGFEGYAVDYRRNCQTYYLPDGDNIVIAMPRSAGEIAARFDAAAVAAQVRRAQESNADYSYQSFCEQVKKAGCAGYLVSFLGRRVVYYGRTAETHIELFPN